MSAPRVPFNPKAFLSSAGRDREMLCFRTGQPIYAQGDAADALFIIQQGTVRLSIKSGAGRGATLDILNAGDFVGTDALAGVSSRTASASAMTDCTLLRIKKRAMLLALKRHVVLANIFWAYVLARNIRYQQDMVSQRCNFSQQRLARILMLLAHFDGHGSTKTIIPRIRQETLAEMVGTTRSRISHFMKVFEGSGLISYDSVGRLRVHRSLLALTNRLSMARPRL